MNENIRRNKNEPSSKSENVYKNLENVRSESKDEVAVVGQSSSITGQSSSIFKLTLDCCDEIFEYLSLKDLHSFGQTCRAMQKVAGQYFQRNFQGAEKFIEDDGIYTVDVKNQKTRTSVFNRFTEFLSYYYASKQPLRYIDWHIDEFTSVKHLYLVCCGLDSQKMEYFQPMLAKIEVLQIRQCILWRDDLYEMLLKPCKNLKRLYIQDDLGYIIHTRGNWLLRNYSTLEHIELTPRSNPKINELQQFFALNPNISSFCTTADAICENRQCLREVNTKLDWLEIKHLATSFEKYFMLNEFCVVLNQLFERGLYKKLHMHVPEVNEELSNHLISLHGLERLTIKKFTNCYNLSQLKHLKELNIFGYLNASNLEILAKSLTNLERLLLQGANYIDLLPFIRQSPKLKHIKILAKEAEHFTGDVINLRMVNEERKKLTGARKVIIYIEDNIFLATKWTARHGDINLNMVEMRRSNSICWDYDYSTIRTLH